MNTVDVTPRERARLVDARVTGPRLQALLAWRRSCLVLAMPVLVLTVVLAVWENVRGGTDGFTGLGKVVIWVPPLAISLVPVAALFVIRHWTELQRTSKILVVCWVASIALPLLVALLPLDLLIELDELRIALRDQGIDDETIEVLIETARVAVAVEYALVLLPIVVTVPAGVLRGAVRVKAVFPASVLPGWFLVAVAPFYSLFMIVVFVLIEQIAGNLLLVVGVVLLAFTPWLFVINRRIYARSMSNAEATMEMARAARPSRWLMLAATACIVIVAVSSSVGARRVVGRHDEDSVFTYVEISRTGIEVIGRSLITTVVFCLILLNMVYADWRNNETMSPEIRREHEREMLELQKFAQENPSQVTSA